MASSIEATGVMRLQADTGRDTASRGHSYSDLVRRWSGSSATLLNFDLSVVFTSSISPVLASLFALLPHGVSNCVLSSTDPSRCPFPVFFAIVCDVPMIPEWIAAIACRTAAAARLCIQPACQPSSGRNSLQIVSGHPACSLPSTRVGADSRLPGP